MKIEKIVSIELTEDELVKLIADSLISLNEDEAWELENSYPSLGSYTFKIVKKDKA